MVAPRSEHTRPATTGATAPPTRFGGGARRLRTTDDWITRTPQRPGDTVYIVWWIIVGLIAGWVTGKLMKGSGYGPLMDIVVGIVGAVIGGFIMQNVFGESSSGGLIYTILVAILGAVILTWLIRLVTGRRSPV